MTRYEVVIMAILALIPAFVIYLVFWGVGWIIYPNVVYTIVILIAMVSGLRKGLE